MKEKPELRDLPGIIMQSIIPLVVLRGQTFVYVNEAAYDSLKLDPSHSVVGTDAFRFVHPSAHEATRALLSQTLSQKQTQMGLPQQLIDSTGSTVRVVAAVTHVDWEGAPAAAITYMVLSNQGDTDAKEGGGPRAPAPAIDLGSLSPRERQVALLVAQGFSVQNIAALLRIRRETVRTHIKAVYRKTRTHTRVELTRLMLGLPGATERFPQQPPRIAAPRLA